MPSKYQPKENQAGIVKTNFMTILLQRHIRLFHSDKRFILQGDNYKHFPVNKRPPKYAKQTDRIEKRNRPFNNNSWSLHFSTFNSGENLLFLVMLTSALWGGQSGGRDSFCGSGHFD